MLTCSGAGSDKVEHRCAADLDRQEIQVPTCMPSAGKSLEFRATGLSGFQELLYVEGTDFKGGHYELPFA